MRYFVRFHGTSPATTRSYFSEGNSVSFPERYSKAERGWDFNILCMRSPRVREICANALFCAHWSTQLPEPTHFEMYLLVILPFEYALGEGGTLLYRLYNNYSMSPRWIWSDKITNERVARVGYNHFISNKGEWNNCFSKFSNRVLPPIVIFTILQSEKF